MIYDFNNPEHFRILEKQAYDGTVEVDGFPPAAYRYFDSLRMLYARYKYDNLGKDEAQAQKQKLLTEYKEARGSYDLFCSVYKAYQENIRKTAMLLSDIEKSRDIREVALKACECIQLMTGDAEFLKRQEVKFREEN